MPKVTKTKRAPRKVKPKPLAKCSGENLTLCKPCIIKLALLVGVSCAELAGIQKGEA